MTDPKYPNCSFEYERSLGRSIRISPMEKSFMNFIQTHRPSLDELDTLVTNEKVRRKEKMDKLLRDLLT